MSLTMEVIKEAVQKQQVENVYESALTTDDAEEVKGVDVVKSKDQSEPELQNGKGATNGHAMHVEMVESNEHFIVDIDAARKRLKKLGFIDTLLMGFSSINNGSEILNTKQTAGSLACLNGIRVFSMFWIILGHSIQYQYGLIDDVRYTVDVIMPSFAFSFMLNSTVSVDSFFMLSGLLLTYLTLKHMKKVNGKVNWFIFYFHRLWRITPTYMITLAIWASLAIHMGEGATKVSFFEREADLCREQWWTNLLYINNLYPFPGNLGAQFFIISPPILYMLYNWGLWAPLSRITFAAYLLHPMLIFVIYLTAHTFYHVTYMQWALTFISNTVVSYFAAFLLSLFVEGPVMSIEKVLLGGLKK
ncbi:uncharacterized protein [Asterias amurensis]|uniref:uncharacterized protein n=1 Tax=Asterias amurensis TaxID=7602 RepID=UPI003AB442C9